LKMGRSISYKLVDVVECFFYSKIERDHEILRALRPENVLRTIEFLIAIF